MKVNNKKAVNKLASKTFAKNRGRNIIGALAILLTTVLFSAVFTLLGVFVQQSRQSQMVQLGSSNQASIKYLSQAEYDALQQTKEYSTMSYSVFVGTSAEESLRKMNIEVRYAQDDFAKESYSVPTVGGMPTKENEIATSTLVLDALGVSHEIGAQVPLQMNIDGKTVQKTFALSGFWEGTKIAPAQMVWVASSYQQTVAPTATAPYVVGNTSDAGYIFAGVNFSGNNGLEKKLENLVSSAGLTLPETSLGINPAWENTASSDIDASAIMVVVLVLCMIIVVGYLIIYNIFYISIAQDIQFYGQLKTLGTTQKQITTIVRKQAFWLSCMGIPVGVLLGYYVGVWSLPLIMNVFFTFSAVQQAVSPSVWVFVFSILFTLLTVFISVSKPAKMAAIISPIQAMNFVDGEPTKKRTKARRKTKRATPLHMAMRYVLANKKRTILVVVSLVFAVTLVNVVYTAVNGFNLDEYVKNYLVGDFYVTDYTIQNTGLEKNTQGISDAFLEEVQEKSEVESVNLVYAETIMQPLGELQKTRLQEMPPEQDLMGAGHGAMISEEDIPTPATLYGISNALLNQIDLLEGEFDEAKWATGKYVILSDAYHRQGAQSPLYNLGDTIVLYDDEENPHEYEVMAIAELKYELSLKQRYNYQLEIVAPEKAFVELYLQNLPMGAVLEVNQKQVGAVEQWMQEYTTSAEDDLVYQSKETYRKEFEQTKITYYAVGGTISLVIGLVGILNFFNAVATSIFARKKEFAILYAVGMTDKQLKQMLLWESLFTIGLVAVLTATVGNLITYFVCKANFISALWAFQYKFTMLPILATIPFLVLVALLVPLSFYKKMKKESIIQRLHFET